MQLLTTEVACEVVVRQHNQYLSAVIHAVRHVLDDGLSQLEVPGVNAVRDRVFVQEGEQIFSDPGIVF